MYEEIDAEYNVSSMYEEEEVIEKIIEFNCNREKMNRWIEDNL